MQYEVEQKYPLEDFQPLESRLQAMGATIEPAIVQIDRYFSHPARDFVATDEAFRIRSIGPENRITYKGPKIDQTTKTRREIELPLPPGTSMAGDYEELLDVLGFLPVATVRKHRREATLDWHGHRLSIALDDVDDVGRFVELEIVANEDGLDAARTALRQVAEQLQLTTIERRGYLQLLLEKE